MGMVSSSGLRAASPGATLLNGVSLTSSQYKTPFLETSRVGHGALASMEIVGPPFPPPPPFQPPPRFPAVPRANARHPVTKGPNRKRTTPSTASALGPSGSIRIAVG